MARISNMNSMYYNVLDILAHITMYMKKKKLNKFTILTQPNDYTNTIIKITIRIEDQSERKQCV